MRWIVAAVCFFCLASSNARAQNGYVGIYADPSGQVPCTTVPQGTGTTLYVVATLDGASDAGITGLEFRIEVSDPTGWYFAYTPPLGSTVLGSVLDTEPQDPDDGSGAIIAFASCLVPTNGRVALGTLGVYNLSGAPTGLLVKRHSNPSNQDFACPLFVLCDAPYYSKVCMSTASTPPCDLKPQAGMPFTQADGAVFVAGLNSAPDSGPPQVEELLPMPPNLLAAYPVLMANPTTPDIVGPIGTQKARTTAATTVAEWSFDASPTTCDPSGWTTHDNLVRSSIVHCNHMNGTCWQINALYDGIGSIQNNAAVLRDAVCGGSYGYGNGWDYAIKLKYRGQLASLSFSYLWGGDDSGANFDGIFVEADSLGLSNDLVDCEVENPTFCLPGHPLDNDMRQPANHRRLLYTVPDPSGTVQLLEALPNFGPGDHYVLIRFASTSAGSDQDGRFDSPIDAGAVIDNIQVTGELTYTEDFEGPSLDPNVEIVNSARSKPFGNWARLHNHVTDNEKCEENTTCSWLFSSAFPGCNYADMEFGPGSLCVSNWLDNTIVSPWVTTSGTDRGLALTFREFGGQRFSQSRIVRSVAIRGTYDNNGECITDWSGDEDDPTYSFQGTWELLDSFSWVTRVVDMSQYFEPTWDKIQVRFRVSDWQWIADGPPPATANPGPGPYIDQVKLERFSRGPVITDGGDTRYQAQDAFATEQNPIAPGEHFSAVDSIFGTCAFSMAADLGIPHPPFDPGSPNLITGDSIAIQVVGATNSGITKVAFCYQIVAGPHAGLKPAIQMTARTFESVSTCQVSEDLLNGMLRCSVTYAGYAGSIVCSVDFDDTYFRGGDVLKYFWYAEGNGSPATASYPPGLDTDPMFLGGIADVELRTDGVLEFSALPAIDWDSTYVARLQADGVGDLDPTPEEIANSRQRHCILYVNKVNTARRTGLANRTSFMETLDGIGYKNHYDVYDLQGFGNTNNDLGTRASVPQATSYALIVHDVGRSGYATIPADSTIFKVDQALWYRTWLKSASSSLIGTATLWVIGENWAFETQGNDLVRTDMGIGSVAKQSFGLNPDVVGNSSFTFHNGQVLPLAERGFRLTGGCPEQRQYDRLTVGAGVGTYRYGTGAPPVEPAVVMNKNVTDRWNTIGMGFNWFDIYDPAGVQPKNARNDLARRILSKVLVDSCAQAGADPVDIDTDGIDAAPRVTALYQNFPNPFNPTTTIAFDLAHDAHAKLRIFDISGRLVKSLVDAKLEGKRHAIVWDGTNDSGRRVATGLYVYWLEAGDFVASRKLVVVR